MQLRFFTVPVYGGDEAAEALNRFLGGHRILAIDRSFVQDGGNCAWSLCVSFEPADGGGRPASGGKRAAPGKGLPIGALTSQQFTNFHLNGLDRLLLSRRRKRRYALGSRLCRTAHRRDRCAGGLRRRPATSFDWTPDDGRNADATRVLCGGSWNNNTQNARAAYHNRSHPDDRNDNIGFRRARIHDRTESGPQQTILHGALSGAPKREDRWCAGSLGGTLATTRRLVTSVSGRRTMTTIIDKGWHPLADGNPPDWASEWGQDRHGVFVAFTVADVTQRLHWIPPGRFMMGSPDDEPGRYDGEGPQHAVTISRGYWLFDTPCTQALWQAVMGGNPSRFKTPDRPVETVSWNGVQEFLGRINGLVPGLALTLPTEAQWEYACRAGTTTALYNGDMAILGDNNAPALDPIAWYGGNGGVGFDLDHGVDTIAWPDKQHPHEKAGTHPVGRKRPNPWGLHDMLGNVWEWCADAQRNYTAEPEADPRGQESAVALRALRGGSWRSNARDARAACRNRYHPDDRYVYIGFRCARVQT